MVKETVRLAVVMNGGVSLAVWMGGVTHEIDRVRRASSQSWRAILDESNHTVVVDLIAGSSAGGLNGAMLAKAIASGSDLPDLLTMWQERARLVPQRLLRRFTPERPDSVLDGDYFNTGIAEVIESIPTSGAGSDITLLVTASALHGSERVVTDAAGEEFTAGDHRRVYRFNKRLNAKKWDGKSNNFKSASRDDFATYTSELSRVARSSAGFPFAFAPVFETRRMSERIEGDADIQPTWLIDGGVLDNAPFGPLLEELSNQPRPDSGPRWVVYVVPGYEATAGPREDVDIEIPPGWTELPVRLWKLSREADLRTDVENLREQHHLASRTRQLPENLLDSIPGLGWHEASSLAGALLPAYQHTTATQTISDFQQRAGENRLKSKKVDPDEVNALIQAEPFWIPTSLMVERMMSGVLPLSTSVPMWQWGLGHAMEMTNWISRRLRSRGTVDTYRSIPQIADRQENLRAIESEYLRILDEVVSAPEAVGGRLMDFHARMVNTELLPRLTETMKEIVSIWAAAEELTDSEAAKHLLTVEVLSHCLSWIEPPAPPFDFFMVSPKTPEGPWLQPDAERSPLPELKGWPNAKLYGDRLSNFGAFGAPKFKDWDWMWGRIDGALGLARALLPVESIIRDQLFNDLVKEIMSDCGMDRLQVYDHSRQVLSMTPSQLIAEARDAGADLNRIVDDTAALLSNASWLTTPPRGFEARVGRWGAGKTIGLAAWWAKRKASRL